MENTLKRSIQSPGGFAVRLGLRLVKGLKNTDAARIIAARGPESFTSVEEVWARASVPAAALTRLAAADAFSSFDMNRRETAWAAKGLKDAPMPLFAAADARECEARPEIAEAAMQLPRLRPGEEVVEDYRNLGLTLREHPVAFLREELAKRGVTPAADLTKTPDGRRVTVAGLVRFRQMPGSAKGVVFVTLKDETAYAQLIVWPKLFERQERIVRTAGLMACQGRLQKDGAVMHVIAERLYDWTPMLRRIGAGEDLAVPPTRGDEVGKGGSGPDPRSPKTPVKIATEAEREDGGGEARITVKSRDFR